MIKNNWLKSYRELNNLDEVFNRLSQRLKRTDALEGAVIEIEREYALLEKDFFRFFPEINAYIKNR